MLHLKLEQALTYILLNSFLQLSSTNLFDHLRQDVLNYFEHVSIYEIVQ